MSKACQLFSGSSGNCIYISCQNTSFLIDAGVSAKRITDSLCKIKVDPKSLSGIFITHEHCDHVKGVRVFASKYNIPVYAQEDCLCKMVDDGVVNDKVNISKISDKMDIGGVDIQPFELSHDSVACVGYKFKMQDGRVISVCTDTGYVTPQAKEKITGSDMVFLESNHEIKMLENGPYPYVLKQRIMSNKGHLSNVDCSEFACELAKSGTTRFVLSHLSGENNFPDIARQTTLSALTQMGLTENIDFKLFVSGKENVAGPIIL